jgi:uncharacterized protein (DUF934 family)
MTDQIEKTEIRIWTPNGFVEEGWQKLADDDALPVEGKFIIPFAVYLTLRDEDREKVAGRAGVLIEPSDDLEPVLAHLSSLALIALSFPAFSDGRAYSKAALLKGRYGFPGILRASGDILIDQVELMIRVGFDELEISNPTALARLLEGRNGGIPLHYQPAQRGETKSNQYSWRRRAA